MSYPKEVIGTYLNQGLPSFTPGKIWVHRAFSFRSILLLCLFHWHCQDAPPPPATQEKAEVFPEDCNRASGFFYSTLLKDCVPIFKTGVKLHPAHPDAKQKGKVYLVFNADSSRIEAWMPFERNTSLFLREKKNSTRWISEDHIVECNGTCRMISGEITLYKEELVE